MWHVSFETLNSKNDLTHLFKNPVMCGLKTALKNLLEEKWFNILRVTFWKHKAEPGHNGLMQS